MIRIGITPGCPAGIGPEVAAKALASVGKIRGVEPVWFSSRALLDVAAKRARVSPRRLAHVRCAVDVDAGERVRPGVVDEAAIESQRDALVRACEAAARGEVRAIVTGPVRKKALVVDGIAYPGQTEIVAHYLGDGAPPLMVFAGGPFLLGLATVHIALADVSRAITPALLDRAIARLDDATRAILGKKRAHIAVLGVNPHAGEGGMFGRDEIDVVTPAVHRALADGIKSDGARVVGPLPADGFFADVARGGVKGIDAVLAMHHDQGLAPYKLLVRGEGINVTWGTRVPRTSPDHGTADALAGTGRASSASMRAAIELAVKLARRRR